MKKLQHIVLSFCLVLSLLFYPNVEASASSVSLGVSSSSINIGDTVTVSVSVPDGITAGVDLSFSSDVLSFVSASADVGANGSVVTINVGKLSLASSNTVSVTFKANTSGTASISANPTSAVDNSTAEEVSLSGASTSITVANQVPEQPSTPPPSDAPSGGDDTSDDEDDEDNAPKSADNSLSTLKLSAGTLSPSFKYNVTKYTATVGYDVENLVVSATPSNGKATIESVTGNGNVKLNVGENTIEIVVQAENGVKATYTIVVTRQEEGEDTPESPDDESSETESQDTPEAEEKESLQWNGQKLQPAENVPKDVVPEDFSVNTVMVNSVEMPCLTFENGDLKVLYLTNEEGTSGLYVYDEAQQMVYPFVKLESNDNYVVVLVPDAGNAPAPENYKACTLSIDGKGVINAYQFVQPVTDTEQTSWFGPETYYAAEPVATDFYLIYCMNNSGEKGWYVYDSVEGTIQRYLGSVHNPVVEPEVETDEITDVTNDEENDALAAKLKQAENMQMIILCVAIFVVIVLVIIIVNLIIRNRSDEDFDDDFDEDDDEYEFEEDEDTTEEVDDEMEIEFYEMPQEEVETKSEESDDEIEIEFYEMPQEEAETKSEESDDEIEIEFYEMPQEEVETKSEESDDEIEIEFYEMSKEEIENDDEVEVEFYDMEELLVQEAVAPEKESSKKEEIIPEQSQSVAPAPVKNQDAYTDDDDDDDDLEFIELD